VSAAGLVVGVDLGTTNSVVAHVDHAGQPLSVANFQGSVLTPSAVLIEGDGVAVGQEALKASALHPEQFAHCFKRFMGDDAFPERVDGRTWRPELLSAMVLRRLRHDASRRLGPVERAVVTVPAYFDECRRRATRNAGLVAGWDVVDLINEPTAAAIAYAHGRQAAGPAVQRLLVYDLGGGTFDVTVLEVKAGVEYRTLATDGEMRLGGHDWDDRLRGWLAERFRALTGVEPLTSTRGQAEFLRHARTVKHALSLKVRATIPCSFGGKSAVVEATRETFERLTADLLERTRTTTELALAQAKLKWQDLDRVLLTGGSTRMPCVGRMLEELTGRTPDRTLSPDEAVAQGAAVYAHLRGQPNGPRVVNVTAHTYGVACQDRQKRRVLKPLAPKNSPLPHTGHYLFAVDPAVGAQVSVTVREGEAEDPADCVRVGTVRIEGLPPAEGGRRRTVGVALTCLEDGRIAVDASVRDPIDLRRVLQRVHATLTPDHGMSAAQVDEARRTLAAMTVT
jgi:molecular chaperone DnaK